MYYALLNSKRMMNNFVNVNKKDPEARDKLNNMLNRYNRIPLKNQSKIGYDTFDSECFS